MRLKDNPESSTQIIDFVTADVEAIIGKDRYPTNSDIFLENLQTVLDRTDAAEKDGVRMQRTYSVNDDVPFPTLGSQDKRLVYYSGDEIDVASPIQGVADVTVDNLRKAYNETSPLSFDSVYKSLESANQPNQLGNNRLTSKEGRG